LLATGSPGGGVLEMLANGELAVCGDFLPSEGLAAARFARYSFTGTPTISVQPVSIASTTGLPIALSATPANGYSSVSAQWYRDGVPLVDGAGGASAGGGTVSGAATTLASPTNVSATTLTITNAQPGDAGNYTVTFTNPCGSVTSTPALVSVTNVCPADINADSFLTFEDFDAFVSAFEAGSATADFNADGFLTFEDFDAFVAAFEAGC
jgi:hypothetical protein